MFARSVFRCSGSLRQSFRSYATETSPKPSSSTTPYIVGAAAIGAGIFGYSYLGRQPAHADAVQEQKKDDASRPPADAPKAFTGGDQGFLDLKLSEVIPYNHNTKTFRFELPQKDQVSGLTIASAVITKFQPEGAEKPVIRPYTPVSDEETPGYMDLLVKVYPNGPMTEHIHSMKKGDTLSIKGPIPKYPWEANKHKHIVLIAGGTGITPMYQLCRKIFGNPDDKTKVSLIFGNVEEGDILLRETFEKMEKDHPQQFKSFFTLDKPTESWGHGKGFISQDVIKEVCPDPKSENIKIFVCGPPGMYKVLSGPKNSPTDQGDLSGILKELGYSKDQVYKF